MIAKFGILKFGKREEEAMRTVLMHCKIDISYDGGGSFTIGDNENNPDLKEIAKAKEGIKLFEWILDTFKQGGNMN